MANSKQQTTKKSVKSLLEDARRRSRLRAKKRQRLEPKTFKYEIALISYVDVLGMKDLLASAGDDASQVAEVLSRFRSFTSHQDYQKELWKAEFVNFSDLAVRILPIMTDANIKYRLGAFFHEIHDLGLIQINLIDRGILVRGAVVIGDICYEGGLTFGPGLAAAYLLETEAKFPRIVVSRDSLRATRDNAVLRAGGNSFVEEMSYLDGFLRKDTDGVWFLDYLALARSDCDSNKQYGQFLLKHKELIEKQRVEVKAIPKADRKNRLSKLKWLIRLHRNHVAQNNPDIFLQETGLKLRACNVGLWR
jgi:hypothetical protein